MSAKKQPPVVVGQKVYVFDPSRRVYDLSVPPAARTAPMYREHWTEETVSTVPPRGRSFNVRHGAITFRLNEDGAWVTRSMTGVGARAVLTAAERDDDIWFEGHFLPLRSALHACRDVAVLRQVAALLGVP